MDENFVTILREQNARIITMAQGQDTLIERVNLHSGATTERLRLPLVALALFLPTDPGNAPLDTTRLAGSYTRNMARRLVHDACVAYLETHGHLCPLPVAVGLVERTREDALALATASAHDALSTRSVGPVEKRDRQRRETRAKRLAALGLALGEDEGEDEGEEGALETRGQGSEGEGEHEGTGEPDEEHAGSPGETPPPPPPA